MHWTWPAVPVGNKHIVYGVQAIAKTEEFTMLVSLSSKGMKRGDPGEQESRTIHVQEL